MNILQQLAEKRAALYTRMREMLDLRDEEKREFTDEETANYNALNDEYDGIEERMEAEQKMEERKRNLEKPITPPLHDDIDPEGENRSEKGKTEMRAAINKFLISGNDTEMRALQADIGASGGFLFMGQQFSSDLIKEIDDQVFIRQFATVETLTNAESLGKPSLDADPADSNWTSEILTGSEDSTMSFGKRELRPNPLAKLAKVSNTLMRRTSGGADSLVIQRLAYKFGITEEKAGMTGTGANQWLGVFTASDNGISTSRDVSTDNTTTTITADNLINCKYTLKAGYEARSRWIFHRDALKQIRKLKDGNSQYIWNAGLAGDKVATILDRPYHISEYAPNTFTTGLYVGILGDFSYYHIVDALTFQIQRLIELYAATNQTGFIGRMESDGMPVLESAFVRVTLA